MTRVLEVGIGTGIGTRLDPRSFQRHAGSTSSALRMLENARQRIAREGHQHITLQRMDAASSEIDAQHVRQSRTRPDTISVAPSLIRYR